MKGKALMRLRVLGTRNKDEGSLFGEMQPSSAEDHPTQENSCNVFYNFKHKLSHLAQSYWKNHNKWELKWPRDVK